MVVLLGACDTGSAPTPSELGDTEKELQRLQELHDARAKVLPEMDIATLAAELTKDLERGREPFNSSAFKEMTGRRESGNELAGLLTAADRQPLLGLLALRQIDPQGYQRLAAEFRIEILIHALGKSETFNTWGLPHLYWEDPARAVID